MNLEFKEMDDRHYAMSPQTQKRSGRRSLHFTCLGCTHVFAVTGPAAGETDPLTDPQFKEGFVLLARQCEDNIASLNEEPVPGTDWTINSIEFIRYQLNGQSWDISDRSCRIFIFCGMLDGDRMQVFFPRKGMAHTVDIAMEMRYILRPYMVNVREQGMFGSKKTKSVESPFCYARFEQIAGYTNGMVTYDLIANGRKYTFPITKEMLGKNMLIRRTQNSVPDFHGTGVILRRVEEL